MPQDPDPRRAGAAPEPGHQAQGPDFDRLEQSLERVAKSRATVLLVGESGTGKSRAAARLHELSGLAGPLVRLHLGALSPTLIESELFGHEAGAFTGAQRARLGAFRRASGGTLVLDDVELLPRESQVKLLRALQERQVEPLGGEGPVDIDARFVATSSSDLQGEVRAGRFREDLFWRLNVVVLELPPLRARLDQLPALVAELLAGQARRSGLAPRSCAAAALERLAAHPWPGNVRELENALERAAVLAGGPRPLEAADFDFLGEAVAGAAERLAALALAEGVDLPSFEAALLRGAWAQARGNVSGAARAAGLSRRAFEYRLERLDAERPGDQEEQR